MIDLTNSECKKGAEAAISLILQSRHRKLRVRDGGDKGKKGKLNLPQNIETPEDDFGKPESSEEHEKRLKKIDDELTGDQGQELVDKIRQETQTKKDKLEQETQAKLKAQKDALDKLNQRISDAKAELQDISMFESELKRCIGDQMKVSRRQADTFMKPNASYAGTKLMAPKTVTINRFEKPIINVYFDKSVSANERVLQRAVECLKQLDIFRKRKMCDYHIFFFAETVSDKPDDVGYGTTAFPEILAHIKKTKANNAIIITDDDFDSQTDFKTISPIDLRGCVWWFWNNGKRAKKAYAYLQGKKGTFQYQV